MRTLPDVVRAWLRRVRWSATASALAGMVALLGTTVLVSALVAVGQPDVPTSSGPASLASVTSERRGSVSASARVATTVVERRPTRTTRTTTTTTTAVATTTTAAGAAEAAVATPSGLADVIVGDETVTFGTGPASGCEARPRWQVARAHPEADVVLSDDAQRLEERDRTTGEVVGVLATWDAAAGAPSGEGVVPAEPMPSSCAPEEPAAEQPA
jgi:hypothetical protein